MTPKFPCGICAKAIVKIHNAVCCDIFNLWVHVKYNNTTKFCYRKIEQSHETWYCQKYVKQVLPFSELIYSQVNRIMKGNFVSSPKKKIQETDLAFLDDESGTLVKNECLAPDEIYKELSTISPTSNLYLHMNISPLPHHSGYLMYLVEKCHNKHKVIGITECRLTVNKTVLSNTNLQDCTYEWAPTTP